MNRLSFALALSLFLSACAHLQASPEPRKVYRIGYVASAGGVTFEAFREGLRTAGYVEGRDVVLETRFTEGRQELFPALVAL